MSSSHKIAAGEHLLRIAAGHGYRTYRLIWEHAGNEPLRAICHNPNVLPAGKQIFIPDKSYGSVAAETGRRHEFVVAEDKLDLTIRLQDENHQAVADTECVIPEPPEEERTDAAGELQLRDIDKQLEHGALAFEHKTVDLAGRGSKPQSTFQGEIQVDRTFALAVGHLDPVTTPSGIQARLNNLGYYAGEVGYHEQDSQALRCAIEEFELEHGIAEPAGDKDDPTMQQRLREVYGC